jgi:catechol 2,3-dioxygenase-like lactoylglutathione lyase family enzyme
MFNEAFSSFSVRNLAAAKRFYGETLGLDVSEQPEGLEISIGGAKIFLYPKPNHTPATFTVLNFLVGDVDQAVDELTKRGVKFEHYDLPDLKTDAKGIAATNAGRPSPGSRIRTATFCPC